MANYIDKLDDQDGNVIYPITLTKAVYKEDTASTVDDLLAAKLDASAYTASDALSKIKTVDGSGSGLDADLLDGKEASAFSLNSHTHTLSNISDLTVTATELNYTDGVTSNIQAQLNTKAPTDSPSFAGTVTAPSFSGALNGNAASASKAGLLTGLDTRSVNSPPSEYMLGGSLYVASMSSKVEFKGLSTLGITSLTGTYCYLMTHTPWTDSSGGYPIQIAYGNGCPCWRVGTSNTTWSAWNTINSGGNADKLDNQEGSYYLNFTNATNKPSPVITLSGDASGSATLTNMGSATLNVRVADDSHNHIISNVDGLQSALDSKTNSSLLGAANGVAQLDANGFVPASQLPSYVDDILEYNGIVNFPATGESGKIYVDTLTNLTYRWSGSSYTEISKSLALGETSSTAYAGDKGKAVTDALASHKNSTSNPHSVTASQVGLGAFETTATNIKMNGTQGVGVLSTVARADHVHPVDTSRAPASHTHTVSSIADLTVTAAEINVLDGIAASTTELNYVDGVTSNVQTQLNSKANTSSLATVATSGSYSDLSNQPDIPIISDDSMFRANDTSAPAGSVEIDANLLDGRDSSYFINLQITSTQPTSQRNNDVWFQVI